MRKPKLAAYIMEHEDWNEIKRQFNEPSDAKRSATKSNPYSGTWPQERYLVTIFLGLFFVATRLCQHHAGGYVVVFWGPCNIWSCKIVQDRARSCIIVQNLVVFWDLNSYSGGPYFQAKIIIGFCPGKSYTQAEACRL